MSAGNKRRDRYCGMRTMSDVHIERLRLHKLKSANRRHLTEDWEDVRCELSPANLLDRALGGLMCSSPTMGNVIAGVQAVMSFFRRRRECECD